MPKVRITAQLDVTLYREVNITDEKLAELKKAAEDGGCTPEDLMLDARTDMADWDDLGDNSVEISVEQEDGSWKGAWD